MTNHARGRARENETLFPTRSPHRLLLNASRLFFPSGLLHLSLTARLATRPEQGRADAKMSSLKAKRMNALAALKAKREGGTGAGVVKYAKVSRFYLQHREGHDAEQGLAHTGRIGLR